MAKKQETGIIMPQMAKSSEDKHSQKVWLFSKLQFACGLILWIICKSTSGLSVISSFSVCIFSIVSLFALAISIVMMVESNYLWEKCCIGISACLFIAFVAISIINKTIPTWILYTILVEIKVGICAIVIISGILLVFFFVRHKKQEWMLIFNKYPMLFSHVILIVVINSINYNII